jgi:spermidine synthase
VIGLGSGALAAYGRVGDAFTYYEIDPAIVRVAEDTRLFTFLRDTNASVRTVVGDGRLTLGADTAARYDTLVIDAFSSDAIPTHLLTSEAIDLYRRRLSPGGVIAFHISNRHFDLAPVLQEVAEHDGLAARMQTGPGTAADPDALSSTWVLLAADAGFLPSGPQWQPLQNLRHIRLWTDQYSNPVSVLRW